MQTELQKDEPRKIPASASEKYPLRMRVPKYRLHKGSGRAVVQYKPFFGDKRHYLPGAYGSKESREAYEELRARIVAHHLKHDAPRKPSRRALVADVAVAYLAWRETRYGEDNNETTCTRHAIAAIPPKLRATRAAEFGPLALEETRECMLKKPSWSRGYVNHQIERLRRMFKWAVSKEFIDVTIYAALKTLPGLVAGESAARETEPIGPVDWSDVARLLPCLPPMLQAMVEVQSFTGMRSDELTGLRGCELDCSGKVWVYSPVVHKTAWRGKVKFICFGPKAQALLSPYLTDDLEAFVFTPAKAWSERISTKRAARKTKLYGQKKTARPKAKRFRPRYDDTSYLHALRHGFIALVRSLFPDEKPKSRPPKGDDFANWLAERGITYWHPHQLRHTRATETRATYGIEGAQAQLGNTIEATEIYAEKSLELARKIASESG